MAIEKTTQPVVEMMQIPITTGLNLNKRKPLAIQSRWNRVVVQKPNTRNHGRPNIMDKTAAYKMKTNLEVPATFISKSFTELPCSTLDNHPSAVDIVIGGNCSEKTEIIQNMFDIESQQCFYFATQNPEISLPNVLDDAFCPHSGVCTPPIGISSCYGLGSTADSMVELYNVTSTRPCGLTHLFKIS